MGQVNAGTITSGTIVNTDIAAGAGLAASKLQHQHVLVADWGYADTMRRSSLPVVLVRSVK
jgi:hypothetical protein